MCSRFWNSLVPTLYELSRFWPSHASPRERVLTYEGFKQLTPDNWLEEDPVMAMFVGVSRTGGIVKASGEDRLRSLLSTQLSDSVPKDIQSIFEVARGAMAYGHFFYPLYSLGTQHLYRALEAAITHRFRMDGGSIETRSLKGKLDWLYKHGRLGDRSEWEAIRYLRNASSHPDFQHVVPPGMVSFEFRDAAARINGLFEEEVAT